MRVAALALLAAACAESPDRAPVARIEAMPAAVVAHDEFQTTVMLDGTTSATFDAASLPLTFEWSFADDEMRTDDPLHEPTLAVQFQGEHPPLVTLTVTDADGLTGSVDLAIALTVTP
ncbi:MAG TPA: hypothetical protein VGM88_19880 [Kofleriaceae bacterium]